MTARFVDIPLSDFPFTIDCFDWATGELLWSETVPEPGAVTIQGVGRDCRIRITWPNGEVTESKPQSTEGENQP